LRLGVPLRVLLDTHLSTRDFDHFAQGGLAATSDVENRPARQIGAFGR